MEDVGGSGLHASNVDRIEMFVIQIRIAILLHDKLAILNLDILCIVLHVESNVSIVRVLLEVIDHPGIHKWLGFAFGFVKQIFDVRRLRENLEDSMGVDTTGLFIFPATWTVVSGRVVDSGDTDESKEKKSEYRGGKHIEK